MHSLYIHPVSTTSTQLNLLFMYTSALHLRGMSCVTVSQQCHTYSTCVWYTFKQSLWLLQQRYTLHFSHINCCLADFVWVVRVLHSGMWVPVLFKPHSTNNTGVILANSSDWPVVSAIWVGWGVVDSTAGSPSCLMSFGHYQWARSSLNKRKSCLVLPLTLCGTMSPLMT